MLRIADGRVYDPANGVDGAVGDVCLRDGKVVADLPPDARRIDARGMVVMPGGVDIHAQIAGPHVNAARKLSAAERRPEPDDNAAILRGGTAGPPASTVATGHRYARLGYTTVVNAGTPPLTARHTLAELRDTPVVDAALLVSLGNSLPLFRLLRDAPERVADALAWWLGAAAGYGVEIVNPGAVELWKRGGRAAISLDDEIAGFDVTPRSAIESVASAVDELALPHPVHVHCNNLGVPGNWRTTADTLATLDGCRAHLAHLQSHAFGATADERPRSCAPRIVEHLNRHREHSADVAPVMFGPAMSATADAPAVALLHQRTGNPWVSAELEAETGCGVLPLVHRGHDSLDALQWGIALELLLLGNDPWRIVLSTDHPNGGSLLGHPRLIRLLMDRDFRNEQIAAVNQEAMRGTILGDDLDREYSLGEIAVITRAGPARLLGLADKGHLGVGADADVAVYAANEDREAMFAAPHHVIKAGRIVVEAGELTDSAPGVLLRVAAGHDHAVEDVLRPLIEEYSSVRFDNYAVREPWLLEPAREVRVLDRSVAGP